MLIMGVGADHTVWAQHVAHLKRSFRCVLLDNRGTGASDAPAGPYSTAQMADDAAAVLRAVGSEPAKVIGISMGGAIAQQLALRHRELVDRMVLTASWARMNPMSEDVFSELRDLRFLLSPGAFQRRLQLLIWSPPAYAERSGKLRAERDELVDEPMTASAFAAQVDACVDHDVCAALPGLDVPVLVTCGEHDVFTPIAAGLELAGLITGSAVERFAGGHAHHWEELNRYNLLCEEFLQ
nr:alpha/beta hydrolase [Ornithinimicrobium cryptoxanthini]